MIVNCALLVCFAFPSRVKKIQHYNLITTHKQGLSWYLCMNGVKGHAQQTKNICITLIQCWTNVFDVGPTLYKCYTNVLCLLGEGCTIENLAVNFRQFFCDLLKNKKIRFCCIGLDYLPYSVRMPFAG